MKRFSIHGLVTGLLLLYAGCSGASAIYQYTGSHYTNAQAPYNTSMFIEATVELPSLLAPNLYLVFVTPVSFSVFDGVITVDSSNTNSLNFTVSTDSSGNIIDWAFYVNYNPIMTGEFGAEIFSDSTIFAPGFALETARIVGCTSAACTEFQYVAEADPNYIAGTWSVSAVPVPAAVWLFGSGLLGLIGIAGRKKAS